MLQVLGVDETAERVYRAMLLGPQRDRDELAKELDLEPADLEAAMRRLAALSLVRDSWDDPGNPRSVSPEIGLTALVAREQARLAHQQYALERGREAVARLTAEFAAVRPVLAPEVEVLAGLDRARGRLEELVQRARFEALSFVAGGPVDDDTRQASRPLNEQGLSRGLRLRTISLESVGNERSSLEFVRAMTAAGVEWRTVPTLPIRMVVIDREAALVPLDPGCTGSGALYVTAPGVVTALVALFEHYWDAATPFGERHEEPDDGITPAERDLLRLLLEGHKDDTVARQFGVSVRTVRRMIADLMDRLGASSRFQAGARAAARGWLDD